MVQVVNILKARQWQGMLKLPNLSSIENNLSLVPVFLLGYVWVYYYINVKATISISDAYGLQEKWPNRFACPFLLKENALVKSKNVA